MKSCGIEYNDITDYIEGIQIIDTHEHLEPLELRLNRKVDLFNVLFSQYICNDLISSGMTMLDFSILLDEKNSLEDKWDIISPHLDNVKNTGYYRVILNVLNDLFGVDTLDSDTYRLINRQILNNNKSDLYERVIKVKSKIKYCIWDNLFCNYDYNAEFIKPVFRIHDFISLENHDSIESFERINNMTLETLDSYLLFINKKIIDAKLGGCIALKNGVAYKRKLYFENIGKPEAESIYIKMYRKCETTREEGLRLQDFLLHEIVRISVESGLPMQIHTGLQSGNGNYITNSNPVHLANIFMEYPEARFCILHGGYPYCSELATLTKNFPNVFIDMSWLHAISPVASARYLKEWLDTVPVNKIFGFGGDYISVELVYGHIKIAKQNIARVLSSNINEGYITPEYAKIIARKLLYQNSEEFFRV